MLMIHITPRKFSEFKIKVIFTIVLLYVVVVLLQPCNIMIYTLEHGLP